MMTNKDLENLTEQELTDMAIREDQSRKKKRGWLLLLLILLLLLLCGACSLAYRYYLNPAPLPELLPGDVDVDFPPHYLYSIYGIEVPQGIAFSEHNDFLYVVDGSAEKLIRVFDLDGEEQFTILPPDSKAPERSPMYLDIDTQGNVYVTDRLQRAIYIYDGEGVFLDMILESDLTLSEYMAKHVGDVSNGAMLPVNIYQEFAVFVDSAGEEVSFPRPDISLWAPVGIQFVGEQRILITDVYDKDTNVRVLNLGENWEPGAGADFDTEELRFGSYGQEVAQFQFPNAVVVDSRGNFYVSDGNNGRISVWSATGESLYSFGPGSTVSALNLPRGLAMDARDRLYVVDAVDHAVKVFDVSGDEPDFMFEFGGLGDSDGLFQFPIDIVVDSTGRIYVTDRENGRIQVWSY